MNLIEKWVELEGYKGIHTESSPAALKFYKAIPDWKQSIRRLMIWCHGLPEN